VLKIVRASARAVEREDLPKRRWKLEVVLAVTRWKHAANAVLRIYLSSGSTATALAN